MALYKSAKFLFWSIVIGIWLLFVIDLSIKKFKTADHYKALCVLHGGVVAEGKCVTPIDLPDEQ